MSVDYYLSGIGFDFDALKTEGPKIGLHLHKTRENSQHQQCYRYEDGKYIWAYRCNDGSVSFCRYGGNYAVEAGLQRLADAIGAELVDDYIKCDKILTSIVFH